MHSNAKNKFTSLFIGHFICNFIPGVWYQVLTNQAQNSTQVFIPVWHSWRLHRHDQRLWWPVSPGRTLQSSGSS